MSCVKTKKNYYGYAWVHDDLWGDTPENRRCEEVTPQFNEDRLCLRKLFGELPYEVWETEEPWLPEILQEDSRSSDERETPNRL